MDPDVIPDVETEVMPHVETEVIPDVETEVIPHVETDAGLHSKFGGPRGLSCFSSIIRFALDVVWEPVEGIDASRIAITREARRASRGARLVVLDEKIASRGRPRALRGIHEHKKSRGKGGTRT